MYRQDLAVDNLQWFICHKSQPTNQLTNQPKACSVLNNDGYCNETSYQFPVWSDSCHNLKVIINNYKIHWRLQLKAR